jgi:hypothetical protein
MSDPVEGVEDDGSSREQIIAMFKRYGPMTTVEMRTRGCKVKTLSAYVANLAKRNILQVLGGHRGATIYGLPAEGNEHGPQFSLNERGELQIGHGQHAKVLTRTSIKLLKLFVDSTEDVWCPDDEVGL